MYASRNSEGRSSYVSQAVFRTLFPDLEGEKQNSELMRMNSAARRGCSCAFFCRNTFMEKGG